MPYALPPTLPHCGVVDLGSNSVRLIVYECQNRIAPSVMAGPRAGHLLRQCAEIGGRDGARP
jgi:hypothetical protein